MMMMMIALTTLPCKVLESFFELVQPRPGLKVLSCNRKWRRRRRRSIEQEQEHRAAGAGAWSKKRSIDHGLRGRGGRGFHIYTLMVKDGKEPEHTRGLLLSQTNWSDFTTLTVTALSHNLGGKAGEVGDGAGG